MKVIKRPDSTSVMLEIPFHHIKNLKELENVLHGVKSEQIIDMHHSADAETFMPKIFFMIVRAGTFGCEYYEAELTLMAELKERVEA